MLCISIYFIFRAGARLRAKLNDNWRFFHTTIYNTQKTFLSMDRNTVKLYNIMLNLNIICDRIIQVCQTRGPRLNFLWPAATNINMDKIKK